mmetsp:Transcript_6828/g.22441  ORF Transcript_6828/g.22441 Transcript_6828/m.22441 type:complete len:330 (+) Transcript_6828:186-1175(+)
MHEVRANWPAVRAGGVHQAGEEDGGSRGREQRRCRWRAHRTQLHWRPTHVPHPRLARVRGGVGGGGASAADAAQGWRRRRRGLCSRRGGRAGRGARAVHRIPPQPRAPARWRGLAGAGLAGVHAALQRGGRAESQLVRRDERRPPREQCAGCSAPARALHARGKAGGSRTARAAGRCAGDAPLLGGVRARAALAGRHAAPALQLCVGKRDPADGRDDLLLRGHHHALPARARAARGGPAARAAAARLHPPPRARDRVRAAAAGAHPALRPLQPDLLPVPAPLPHEPLPRRALLDVHRRPPPALAARRSARAARAARPCTSCTSTWRRTT